MRSISSTEVPTPDGVADALLAVPEGDGPWPGVLLFMDAFGLRPRLEEMAARIATEGYVVLVPNVFYREGRAPLVDAGRLGSPERRAAVIESLRPLMARLTPDLADRDVAAYLRFLDEDDRVAAGPVATVGYCMGGALAIRAAAAGGEEVAAVASFHGGRLATDDPASPHLLADRITAAEVYLGHADHDASMPPEQQGLLTETLTAAGVEHTAELYAGAAHGFTMADTAAYDEAATEQHWNRLLALLDRRLRRRPSAAEAKYPQIG